jgi:hypothetical protein
MLRHRATIQAIRYFMALGGLVDREEYIEAELETPAMRSVTSRPVGTYGSRLTSAPLPQPAPAPAPEPQPEAPAEPIADTAEPDIFEGDELPGLAPDDADLCRLEAALKPSRRRMGDVVLWAKRNHINAPDIAATREQFAAFASWLMREPSARELLCSEFNLSL